MKYVVDTHALIWFLEGNPRLGGRARAVLQDPASELVLPIICLAEACWVVEHGRLNALLAAVDGDPRISPSPLDRTIVGRSSLLTSIPEMHDRQIAATALELIAQGEAAVVLTKDHTIRSSGVVPVDW